MIITLDCIPVTPNILDCIGSGGVYNTLADIQCTRANLRIDTGDLPLADLEHSVIQFIRSVSAGTVCATYHTGGSP